MILASKSPRRQELLHFLTTAFQTVPSEVDESVVPVEPVSNFAERLACAKALDVASKYPKELVVGCDTVVLLGETVLGKPKDARDAKAMLRALSGKTHQVVTGVCLAQQGKTMSFSQGTTVQFYPLRDDEIDRYIQTGEPFDKAGAYGIQGYGCLFVQGIVGDYFNVMGLPVARLGREIETFMNNR